MRIPKSWPEMPSRMLRPAMRIALGNSRPEVARLRMLGLLGLDTALAFRIDPVSLHALTREVAWMQEPCSDMPFQELEHAGMVLTLPGHGFQEGTCLEWALADEYYEDIVRHDRAASLPLLCATLLRHTRGGTRERIIDRRHIETHARTLGKLPEWVQSACLLYMSGVKQQVYDTYNEWLFKKPVEGQDEQPPSGPDFGWWGTYMSVAETGTFGTYEQVLQTGFHTLCVYLVQRKKEADEARRRMQNPKAQTL
jgi:hypothetical protein